MGEFSIWHWSSCCCFVVPIYAVLGLFCNSAVQDACCRGSAVAGTEPRISLAPVCSLSSASCGCSFLVIAVRKGYERMTAAGRLARPSDGAGGLGMTLAVFGVLNCIPYLNLITGIVSVVLFIIYWNRLVDVRRLVLAAPSAEVTRAAPGIPLQSYPVAAPMVASPVIAPTPTPKATVARPSAPPPAAAAAPSSATGAPGSSAGRAVDSDDDLFEQVGMELESGRTVRAVWTRAFAEAEGDDNKARVIYIRHRMERLKADREATQHLERELGIARQQQAALLKLQRTALGPIAQAREASDSPDAARFRASVRGGALADVDELLTRHPYFIHLRTAGGESMLQLASYERLPQMASLLVARGARDWPDATGSAISIARDRGDAKMLAALEAAIPGPGESYDPQQAAAQGPYRGQQILLLAGGKVQVQGHSRIFDSVEEATDAIDAALKAKPT